MIFLNKLVLVTSVLLSVINIASAKSLVYGVVIKGESAEGHQSLLDATVEVRVQLGSDVMTCSGTLIERDIVVTAGHCFQEMMTWPEASGITVKGAGFESQALAFDVSRKYYTEVINDGFVRAKFAYNDIAILRMKTPVSLNVQPAALPAADFVPAAEQEFIVAGFGQTDRYEKDSKGSLMFLPVNLALYQDAGSNVPVYKLKSGMHCKGDSGGPVYLESNEGLILVGVNTWGDCSSVSRAEIVARHLEWIEKKIQEFRQIVEI